MCLLKIIIFPTPRNFNFKKYSHSIYISDIFNLVFHLTTTRKLLIVRILNAIITTKIHLVFQSSRHLLQRDNFVRRFREFLYFYETDNLAMTVLSISIFDKGINIKYAVLFERKSYTASKNY